MSGLVSRPVIGCDRDEVDVAGRVLVAIPDVHVWFPGHLECSEAHFVVRLVRQLRNGNARRPPGPVTELSDECSCDAPRRTSGLLSCDPLVKDRDVAECHASVFGVRLCEELVPAQTGGLRRTQALDASA